MRLQGATPHSSVRAMLPQTAPALSFGESYLRKFVAYSEAQDVSIYYGRELLPVHSSSFLTSAPQAPVPRFRHKVSETFQGLDISRYSKVLPITLLNTFQPVASLYYWCMHPYSQDLFDFPYRLAQSFAYGLPSQKEASFPILFAQVFKHKKIKSRGFSLSPFLPSFCGISAELFQTGFLRVQCQTKTAQLFFKGCKISFCLFLVLCIIRPTSNKKSATPRTLIPEKIEQ